MSVYIHILKIKFILECIVFHYVDFIHFLLNFSDGIQGVCSSKTFMMYKVKFANIIKFCIAFEVI